MCHRPLPDAPETQFCLVRDGELISTSYKPSPDPDGGAWLPIENEDSAPFDPTQHLRMKPLPLRLDAERGVVVRTYPLLQKPWELA
ncbi:hypothetical protein BKD09_24045 [Bradyrhizobium japonicum]|uniref:Uncharacterized protein n=1 Tax=Bradyrhizobium japonicum TaxID=375 RepID=A0A1L3FDP5_BRAJP|nr:hypothetical protein BKD09_24045 [Bradyrhizobium japonicum]